MFFRLYAIILLSLIMNSVVLAQPTGDLSRRQTQTGTATFFFQGGNPGACGLVHLDQDHIVALQTTAFANGANCGRTISITDTNTDTTATGVVADACPGCSGTGSIDLSQGLFEVFAPDSQGTFPVSWKFV